MVWGALSLRGFYLKIIEGGTVNAEKYCQIVDEFIPYANRLYPEGWILDQDAATPHTARKTMEFFEEKNLQFLQWPPNSPDVNPIENVEGIIEKCSWAKKSKNQARTDRSNTEFQKCHHEGNQRKFDEFCWKASKVL